MIFGRYRDEHGRECVVYDGRGGIREILANYEACGESALDEEEPMTGAPTRTVDAEIDDRVRTYMRVNGIADYRTALQKVLDADPALKAAYSDRPVPVRAAAKAGAPADQEAKPQDAEAAKKRIIDRALKLSKMTPYDAMIEALLQDPDSLEVLLQEARG